MQQRVLIQTADFDLSAESDRMRLSDAGIGALCAFVGTVRDGSGSGQNAVNALELQHYPGMTESAIEAMIDQATRRFNIRHVRVIHRIGLLRAHEQIVLVLVAAAHRRESFEACEFLMDYLKTQAPFWKKEHTPEGAHWVDARASDDAALSRWGIQSGNAGVLGTA